MKKILFFLPPILWMALIFFLSGRQKVAITDSYAVSFLIFKTFHIIEYATLFILLFRGFRNATDFSAFKSALVSLFIVMIYGITDEIHQSFIPTREARVRDGIIDSIGGGVGWIIVTILIRQKSAILKKSVKLLGLR